MNAPRCYFDKSSSSSSNSATNSQGSAENGSIGIGGDNTNTSFAVNITSTDSATANAAISAINSVNTNSLAAITNNSNNAIDAENNTAVNALGASAEANSGIVQIAGKSLDAVNAANAQAQTFVNQNTALAFGTIDQLITGQTDALAYETSTANASATGASTSTPNYSGLNQSYVGPASNAPAPVGTDNSGGLNNAAVIVTLLTGAIALYYYFSKGKSPV